MKNLFKNRGNSVKDGPSRQRRSLGSLFGTNRKSMSEGAMKRMSSMSIPRSDEDVAAALEMENREYQRGALPVNVFTISQMTPMKPEELPEQARKKNVPSAKRPDPLSLKLPRRDSEVELVAIVASPGEPGGSVQTEHDNAPEKDAAMNKVVAAVEAHGGSVEEQVENVVASDANMITIPAAKKTRDVIELFSYDTNFINRVLEYSSGDHVTLCRLSMLNMTWLECANSDIWWKPHLDHLLAAGRSTIGLDENLSCKARFATLYQQSQLSEKKASKIAIFARTRRDKDKSSKSDDGNKSSRSSVNSVDETPSQAASPSPSSSSASLTSPTSEVGSPRPIEKKKSMRTPPKPKQLEPIDPTPYYCVDISTITYKEDGDDCVKWVLDKDGNRTDMVESATLNKLVELLTSPDFFDQHFLHTFIITYRSLMDRETLINMLIERYNIPPPHGNDPVKFAEFKREKLDKIRLRVTNTVRYWLENFYVFDFDEELIKHYERLVTMMESSKGEALARMLRNSMAKANEKATASNFTASKLTCPPVLYPKKSLFGKSKKDDIMSWPMLEVARQITLIDFDLFSRIDPKECLNQSWNKEHRKEKAPNISNFIEQFNRLSKWIGTVVVKMEDLEKRVKLVCKFIDMAEHCKNLNNFNGLFSVLSGLKLSGIYRLKETWKNVPEDYMKKFDTLSEYMKNDGNFKNVRTAIKAVRPPCIPYIGLYLTDLTFIEDGMPKYNDDEKKMINFEKCSKFAEVIRDMQTYQNQRYALTEVPELRDMLLHSEIMTEEEMFEQSLKIEARKRKKRRPKSTESK